MSVKFAGFANWVARASGRPLIFAIASLTMIMWLASGPLFGFSNGWQLMVNTATNIVTFLMVFLIQNTQNRDSAAIQAKLDELIRVSGARNAYIGIEHLTEEQIREIRCSTVTPAADRVDGHDRGADDQGSYRRSVRYRRISSPRANTASRQNSTTSTSG